MRIVRIWDYFMRRKALLLTVLGVFFASGFLSYRIFCYQQQTMVVPLSGEVVVSGYIDEVMNDDLASRTDASPVIAAGSDGSENPSPEQRSQNFEVRFDITDDGIVIYPDGNQREVYKEPQVDDATRTIGSLTNKPEVNPVAIALVGCGIITLILVLRALAKKALARRGLLD